MEHQQRAKESKKVCHGMRRMRYDTTRWCGRGSMAFQICEPSKECRATDWHPSPGVVIRGGRLGLLLPNPLATITCACNSMQQGRRLLLSRNAVE